MTDRGPVAPDFDPQTILTALTEHEVDYVVIGGVAAALHGSDQATFDLDVAYRHDAKNLQRLVKALRALDGVRVTHFPDERPTPVREEDFTERVERFVTPAGAVDTFAQVRAVGGYEDLRPRAEAYRLDTGAVVMVASIEDIIASKAGTGRAKDPQHIRSLERVREERARQREEERLQR